MMFGNEKSCTKKVLMKWSEIKNCQAVVKWKKGDKFDARLTRALSTILLLELNGHCLGCFIK